MATYKAELRFEIVGQCEPETLENAAIALMERIDEGTSDSVSGVAVSVDFSPPAIELDLSIEAGTDADFHRVLADVAQLMQGAGVENSGYSARSRREPVPA